MFVHIFYYYYSHIYLFFLLYIQYSISFCIIGLPNVLWVVPGGPCLLVSWPYYICIVTCQTRLAYDNTWSSSSRPAVKNSTAETWWTRIRPPRLRLSSFARSFFWISACISAETIYQLVFRMYILMIHTFNWNLIGILPRVILLPLHHLLRPCLEMIGLQWFCECFEDALLLHKALDALNQPLVEGESFSPVNRVQSNVTLHSPKLTTFLQFT